MLTFSDFLTEKYVNLFSANDKEKYGEVVFDLIQECYRDIGGFKANGFKTVQDMIKNVPMWKLSKKDDRIVAGLLYKDKNGRKCVCCFTNGTQEGKDQLGAMMKADVTRAYTEVSKGALGFICKTYGVDFVKKYAIDIETVKELSDDDILSVGSDDEYGKKYPAIKEFFYARKLGSSIETKIMLGTPKLKIK